MFQYFLKVRPRSLLSSLSRLSVRRTLDLLDPCRTQVVSTKFEFLDGRALRTHQYSVTQYERDCASLDPPLSRSCSIDA